MSRQFFVSLCPSCKQANQVDVKRLGMSVTCHHCHQNFQCDCVDSQSAALNSLMSYWSRYTMSEDDRQIGALTESMPRLPK